jgi:hypothetical protein
MKPANPQTELLLRMLDEAFEKRTWHGPNLKGSIRGLTLGQLLWRPKDNRHNIWEIVVHATYWKYAVRRRITGEQRGSFPLKGSNWIPRRGDGGLPAWREDVRLLDETHTSLRGIISRLTSQELHVTPPGSTVSNISQIYGVAFHDVYHAGQIQLLKRLIRQQGIR